MKKTIKILTLVTINVILTLALIEFSLRISGKIYYAYRLNKSTNCIKEDKNDAIRILCLGDSFTFGMGAKKGYSYPEQLEHMLNNNNPDKKFIVYNRGMPGNTSSKLLNSLRQDLSEYRPQIVIVLIGTNDPMELKESNFLLFQNNNFAGHLFFYLYDIRCYKLFRIIKEKIEVAIWRKRISSKFVANDFLPQRNTDECVKKMDSFAQDYTNVNHDNYEMHLERAEKYCNNYDRNMDLAIEELKKAIELESRRLGAHYLLGKLYISQGRQDLAIEKLHDALLIDPSNPNIYCDLSYAYYRSGDTILTKEVLEKYLYLNPSDISNYLHLLRNKIPPIRDNILFSNLYKFNLKKIIAECKKRKTTIILQNYPNSSTDDPSSIKDIAFAGKIYFVDNETHFFILSQQRRYKKEDYLCGDYRHCNERGYGVMAENIYNLIKDDILPLNEMGS